MDNFNFSVIEKKNIARERWDASSSVRVTKTSIMVAADIARVIGSDVVGIEYDQDRQAMRLTNGQNSGKAGYKFGIDEHGRLTSTNLRLVNAIAKGDYKLVEGTETILRRVA